MTGLGRIGRFELFFIFSIGLWSVPAIAEMPPQLFSQAKAPFPKKDEDVLRKRLELLSAKKSWDKANKLATERLGQDWCRAEVALEFRTFAALGVVARQIKKPELAVYCAIRSLNLADSQIERGMAHFELFLLVDAMKPEQFRAFLEKLASIPKDHCDDPRNADCCAHDSGLDFAKYLDPSSKLKGDALSVAQRDIVASDLLGQALSENPSEALMARYTQRTGRSDSASRLEVWSIPVQLVGERFGSLKEAKLAARSNTKTLAKMDDRGKAVIAPSRWVFKPSGSWTLYDGFVGYHYDRECDGERGPNNNNHYFIIGASDGFWLYRDSKTYYDNACGGYGDEWSTSELSVTKTPNGEVLTTGGASFSYINGGGCGASGGRSSTQIMCAKNAAGDPKCLLISYYFPWSLEGRELKDKPFIKLDKRGRVDFELEMYSSELRALLRPVDKKSVIEVYEAIPEIVAKIEAWAGEK